MVDRHFLELWGNLLINAAKGQERMEELTQWISQGLKGFDGLNAVFRRYYRVSGVDEDSPDDSKAWQEAVRDFQKSFKDYLNQLGVVSKGEHLALIRKYEDLKKKSADQEETINHLRMLLDEKEIAQGEVTQGFQDLIRKQTEQFQDLVKGLGQFLQTDSSGNDNEKTGA